MFKTESEQRARIENINNAEIGNRSYLRRVRIQDYLSGQAIYGLGDYPAKVSAKPTDYDRALIKKLAECGVDLIQVHEEWNDACRLYGGDKYNAVDKEGIAAGSEVAVDEACALLIGGRCLGVEALGEEIEAFAHRGEGGGA